MPLPVLIRSKTSSMKFHLGKPQKITVFFSGPATKRGGGRTWPLRKRPFFEALKKFLETICGKFWDTQYLITGAKLVGPNRRTLFSEW